MQIRFFQFMSQLNGEVMKYTFYKFLFLILTIKAAVKNASVC